MGGLETVVAQLIDASHAAPSVRLTCFALLPDDAPLPAPFAALSERGIVIQRISAAHRAYPRHYRGLRRALVHSGVNLIHSHGYHADVLAGLLAGPLRIPHVSTLHGFVGGSRRGRAYEWLQISTLRRASAVVAVSDSVAAIAHARGVKLSRVHVIPNAAPGGECLSRAVAQEALGLSVSQQPGAIADDGSPGRAPLLGWIGRMSAEKEPLALVAVLKALRDAAVPATGVMIGDGPLMPEVRKAAAQLIRSGALLLTGVVPDAGRLVSAFDALLITSSTEGTPMVALEAMRAGVPVISTAVGGVPAMLEEQCGLLVPHGDTEAMQNAVVRLMQDPALVHAIADRARKRVSERFSRVAWWNTHVQLYTDLVRAAGDLDGQPPTRAAR